MIKYSIKTDEEFFYRFSEVYDRVKGLSRLFQNSGTEATAEEVAEWEFNAEDTLESLKCLLDEASRRIG